MSRRALDDHQLIVVIDESSPGDGVGGIAYVVAAAALMSPAGLSDQLHDIFETERSRPFHWTKEGPEARRRIIELMIREGVVAEVLCAHVGRRGQRLARQRMIAELSIWAATEGASHVVIESGDAATDGRDKATLLDTHRDRGGVPFEYDWRPKSEPLLWIADAVAGAVSEHVAGKDSSWFELLDEGKVVHLRYS